MPYGSFSFVSLTKLEALALAQMPGPRKLARNMLLQRPVWPELTKEVIEAKQSALNSLETF